MTVAVSDANRIRATIRNLVADRAELTFAAFHEGLSEEPRATLWLRLADLAGVDYPTKATRDKVLAWLATIHPTDTEGDPMTPDYDAIYEQALAKAIADTPPTEPAYRRAEPLTLGQLYHGLRRMLDEGVPADMRVTVGHFDDGIYATGYRYDREHGHRVNLSTQPHAVTP